ncbi:hypothetical protein DFP72DRAFT_1075745 [Ephemerocybe angulata]|uniref:Uncharacterized protein n=1 Tax=Ephemerocybe angulata TaxID=980116 RepID=A0A8H6HHF2_9AGAR|nr:hypothetical protein DFP72DRAFT_1075745 [Tulosesus angulatus]
MNWRYEAENARLRLDSFIQQSTQVGEERSGSTFAGLKPGTVVEYSEPPCLRMIKESDGSQEEVAVTVPGIFCDKTLPPVFGLRSHKFEHVRYLRQFVRLTGLGSNNFQDGLAGFSDIETEFQKYPEVTKLTGFDFGVYESEPCVALHARYLTERRLVRSQRHIPFPPEIDPNHALEDARDWQFIRAEDNAVQYAKKTVEKDGTVRIEPLRPEDFKEGDLVEATGAFVAYPSSKVGDTFREAAQVKRKATMEEAQVKKPPRKKTKMPTAMNLKRAHISYGGVGGGRDTAMGE